MDEIVEEENGVVVEGDVVGFEERELRTNAVILSILLRDETNGLLAKIRFGSFKEENDLVKNKKEAEALQKKDSQRDPMSLSRAMWKWTAMKTANWS